MVSNVMLIVEVTPSVTMLQEVACIAGQATTLNQVCVTAIPILDIVSSIVALILIYIRFAKYNVHLVQPSLRIACRYIKESCTYFLSSAATTAFGAL